MLQVNVETEPVYLLNVLKETLDYLTSKIFITYSTHVQMMVNGYPNT